MCIRDRDYGVIFTKNTALGEYLFIVPDSVTVKHAKVNGTSNDGDVGDEIYARFIYEGTRTFNNSLNDAWQPKVLVSNRLNNISRSSPAQMDNNLLQFISDVGDGEIELVLNNATKYYANPVFNFYFN